MCLQGEVLNNIKNKKQITKVDRLSLAEAQAQDYIMMTKEIKSIKNDVSKLKKGVKEINTSIISVKAQNDIIIKRLNSTVEDERKAGIIWNQIRRSGWKGWVLLIIFLAVVAMAGDNFIKIMGWIPTGI